MQEKTDLQIFIESYNKYKDKTGKKAMSLKRKIDGIEYLNNLFKKYCSNSASTRT